jgi:hypothetical protein
MAQQQAASKRYVENERTAAAMVQRTQKAENETHKTHNQRYEAKPVLRRKQAEKEVILRIRTLREKQAENSDGGKDGGRRNRGGRARAAERKEVAGGRQARSQQNEPHGTNPASSSETMLQRRRRRQKRR